MPKCCHYGFLLICLLLAWSSLAEPLTITVLNQQGEPFPGAVVELKHPDLTPASPPAPAVMDQVNKQFKPHVLAVQQGAHVTFPNSDSIKHHVYSFSKPKRFQLKLYKDQQPDPLVFDKPGIVALGCNVHDWMVGYIYVAESAAFRRTDDQGKASFDVKPESYEVVVWHPRFREQDKQRSQRTSIGQTTLVFQLQEALYPMINDQADEFDEY